MEEDEKTLVETIQKIVKEDLAAHEVIKQMINANMKNTNDRLDNIPKEVADLKESLEFRQDKMKDDISGIKKELKELDKNIRKVRKISYIHFMSHQNLVSLSIVHAEIIQGKIELRNDQTKHGETVEVSVQDMLKEELGIPDDVEFGR